MAVTAQQAIDWLCRSEATVDFRVGAITVHLKLHSEIKDFTASTVIEACRLAYGWQQDAITAMTTKAGGLTF